MIITPRCDEAELPEAHPDQIPGTDDRARGLNAMNEVQVTGWLWLCIALGERRLQLYERCAVTRGQPCLASNPLANPQCHLRTAEYRCNGAAAIHSSLVPVYAW